MPVALKGGPVSAGLLVGMAHRVMLRVVKEVECCFLFMMHRPMDSIDSTKRMNPYRNGDVVLRAVAREMPETIGDRFLMVLEA